MDRFSPQNLNAAVGLATATHPSVTSAQYNVDIAQQAPGALNHRRMDKAFDFVHEAETMPGSLIAKIMKKPRFGVNSTHHQAIAEPADPFIATARSSEGVAVWSAWPLTLSAVSGNGTWRTGPLTELVTVRSSPAMVAQ